MAVKGTEEKKEEEEMRDDLTCPTMKRNMQNRERQSVDEWKSNKSNIHIDRTAIVQPNSYTASIAVMNGGRAQKE
uniref:Uncharacterized protein n=1 Tax=Pristionchus pacificus TaxID=54126 RepID=A0A2A6CVQ8_PRIPA|eukprot:PDM82123.1 hypothetical protein PRIPAC_36516 [Pristionchus pacificus]